MSKGVPQVSKFLLLVFLLSIFIFSCTKSISQLIVERNILSQQDYEFLYERIGDADTIELSVDEAIEFALRNNLDLRVQEAELRVFGDAIGREMILMLPNLEISALVERRSNLPAASAESVVQGIPLAIPSFSSLRTTSSWNVELAWNILNTGIEYFRVKEAKNTLLAREFIYQRTVQNLIRDVVASYWLVATMQASQEQLDEITEISRDLTKKLHEKVDEQIISLQQASELIGRIYYQQVQAKLLLRSYQGARDQLKALLGIPPCIDLKLKVPKEKLLPAPLPSPYELHMIALNFRPELYQVDVELAVHEDELREAILAIFPTLIPFLSYSEDANPFLTHNSWSTYGFRALYNLLSIPLSLNSQMTAEDRIRVSKAQRVFLSLTILSQIHITYAQYLDALDRFKDARIYWIAKKNSYDLALAKKNLNAIGDLEYVFPLADLGFAETQMNLFYVEVMGYLEQMSNTIGIPRYFTEKYEAEVMSKEKE